jgi:hypothetical protein
MAYFWIFVSAYALSLITAYERLSARIYLRSSHPSDVYRRRTATPRTLASMTFYFGTALGMVGASALWMLRGL